MAASIDSLNDLKELGIDCDGSDSLTETFNQAADHLQTLVEHLDTQTLLTLYGYYKQGSQGPCNTLKPSWYDMKAKTKWEAWNKLGQMSQKEAKTIYIETIKKLDPDFKPSKKESWVSVSVLQKPAENSQKTLVDYVKEEDFNLVEQILNKSNENINKIYDDGLGLIHWAADRGSVEMLKILIGFGADVDLQDLDGQTALHYASSCDHVECVRVLLENNAKPDIADYEGATPESLACEGTVKELLVKL